MFIKVLELQPKSGQKKKEIPVVEEEDAKVEGTGSGFVWDKAGHIVRI